MNELKHVAVIADGNGRWATMRNKSRSDGHEQGLHKIEDMMHWCVELNIPVLSVYVFSLENWKRPKEEVDNLGNLAEHYFDRYQEFVDNNIKVVVSGVEDNFEQSTLDKIQRIQDETRHCTGLILNLCANYSGRREILDAIRKGARTEEEMSSMLYHDLPEPDLIIRTGGRQRLSNFLMWQSAYSELYFTETLFPDLSLGEFKHAIKQYERTTRNFGGV
jgi:undecaprenyl diphosphate synthase